jgi:putative CocE/NonD family hydrolase
MIASDTNDAVSLVELRWAVKIPVRDGVVLDAMLYLPGTERASSPALFILTPYTAQSWHEFAMYFAERGYAFLSVDVRGRGNSDGIFDPNSHEAEDGFDVTEWIARQSFCDGQVGMWGGSYSGFAQWATVRNRPPSLKTIAPTASPYIGADFPMRGKMLTPYVMQWLTLVGGRTAQDKLFWDDGAFWSSRFKDFHQSGQPFCELDRFLGMPSPVFQGWVANVERQDFWDRYNPSAADYSATEIPILTITGIYDGDQPGALIHYRNHLQHSSAEAAAKHYLVIGPWDHAGTRSPQSEFGGMKVGAASLVDLKKLHLEWYDWTMRGGGRPSFLQNRVVYYVMGADVWRYADSLDAITSDVQALWLDSSGRATDPFHSGYLTSKPGEGPPDAYRYDPSHHPMADLESEIDHPLVDQRMLYASMDRQAIYHSAPFERATEVSGFFRLEVWIGIDQADTDFEVSVYVVGCDGSATLFASDAMRARYRTGLNSPELVKSPSPERYVFEGFNFSSREMKTGDRLRLVIGPIQSIYRQRNCNIGGDVSLECAEESNVVSVEIFHDKKHPSFLQIPLAGSRKSQSDALPIGQI